MCLKKCGQVDIGLALKMCLKNGVGEIKQQCRGTEEYR